MKNLFKCLLVISLAFFGSISIYLYSNIQSLEQVSNISINVVDRHSALKNEVIDDFLALQESLVIPLQTPVLEESAKNGHLLIQLTGAYINQLLEEKNGLIICAYLEQTLVGYIVITDISGFKELYEESTGFVEPVVDLSVMEKILLQTDIGYIEQIGVKPGYSRRGIGARMIQISKKLKSNGLIADIFLEPVKNEASLQFFFRQGFEKSGILYQYPRHNFPYTHRTQIVAWNLNFNNF